KEARELFDIRPGDNLLLLGDEEKGIAIVKEDLMKKFALKILESMDSITEKWESNRK
ncbi:MAG: AbrB family transcriptional regulator, partial [Theionarchaea archaeon]|nr:AbrB family transcriptional regulator [Theionarchaea archaeon]